MIALKSKNLKNISKVFIFLWSVTIATDIFRYTVTVLPRVLGNGCEVVSPDHELSSTHPWFVTSLCSETAFIIVK